MVLPLYAGMRLTKFTEINIQAGEDLYATCLFLMVGHRYSYCEVGPNTGCRDQNDRIWPGANVYFGTKKLEFWNRGIP